MIVSFTRFSSIYDIPVLFIQNGINAGDLPVRNIVRKQGVNFLCVSGMAAWHGLDRFIRGMGNYYNSLSAPDEIFLHLAGEGPANRELKQLASDLGIANYVFFYGNRAGHDLDPLFDKADIGIDSLGAHRRGYNESHSIKAREYAARGLPFITSGNDVDFPPGIEFALRVPPDESPVDIIAILKFYRKTVKNDYRMEMRAYAEKNLSWNVKLDPVIKYIKRGCS
jgi:glycosyltransferase involved in cell wall biosynthesis